MVLMLKLNQIQVFQGIEIYDRNGKKLDGKNRKLESIKDENENENKNKNNITTFEIQSNIEIISANNNDINTFDKNYAKTTFNKNDSNNNIDNIFKNNINGNNNTINLIMIIMLVMVK